MRMCRFQELGPKATHSRKSSDTKAGGCMEKTNTPGSDTMFAPFSARLEAGIHDRAACGSLGWMTARRRARAQVGQTGG